MINKPKKYLKPKIYFHNKKQNKANVTTSITQEQGQTDQLKDNTVSEAMTQTKSVMLKANKSAPKILHPSRMKNILYSKYNFPEVFNPSNMSKQTKDKAILQTSKEKTNNMKHSKSNNVLKTEWVLGKNKAQEERLAQVLKNDFFRK